MERPKGMPAVIIGAYLGYCQSQDEAGRSMLQFGEWYEQQADFGREIDVPAVLRKHYGHEVGGKFRPFLNGATLVAGLTERGRRGRV